MSVQISDISARTQLALPAILLVVVAGLAIWFGLQTEQPRRSKVLVLHPALTSTQAGAVDIGKGSGLRMEQTTRMNDPFFRLPEVSESSSALADGVPKEVLLTTIADGRNGRYCMINGKVFSEGQSGNDFVVQTIGPSQVLVALAHATFQLAPGQKAAFLGGRLVSLTSVVAVQPEQKQGDIPQGVEQIEDKRPAD